MTREGQHARCLAAGVLDNRAVGEPQDNRVRIIGRGKERPFLRRDREDLTLAVGNPGENTHQLAPVILAFFDTQGHAVGKGSELADLYRSAQRARSQVVFKALVGKAADRLDEENQRNIDRHEHNGDRVGHA